MQEAFEAFDELSCDSNVFEFHGESFSRPTTIPADLFQDSINAMNAGIQRNGYVHWTRADGGKRPECNHEVCRGHTLSSCADCRKLLMHPKQIIVEKEWQKKIRSMDAKNKDHNSMLHSCGVTVEWLLAFTFDHDCWEKSTYWVNRHIVKEATKGVRRRYAHLPKMIKYTGAAHVFVSHPWGSKWGDVVLAACHGARKDRIVWIDLFAVRQWPGRDADMNFRGVIKKCQATIVSISPIQGLKEFIGSPADRDRFLNSEEGKAAQKIITVFRLWCNVEIAAAIDNNVSVVVKCGYAKKRSTLKKKLKKRSGKKKPSQHQKGKKKETKKKVGKIKLIEQSHVGNTYEYATNNNGDLLQNLMNWVDIESSSFSMREDYDRELAIIRNIQGGTKRVNQLIAGVLFGAKISIEYSMLEVDAYVCGEREALRAMLVDADQYLSSKILQAACCSGRVEIVRELLSKWSGETLQKEEEKEEKNVVVSRSFDR